MMMDNFFTSNWWSITLVILVACFYGLKFVAHSHAKTEAIKYLYAASKLSFASGDLKIAFVSQMAYAVLPKVVKAFIPANVFGVIVSSLYAEVKDLVNELHNSADQSKPQAPAPAQPAEVKPVAPTDQKQAK